jgi:hypothetical protein
MKEKGKPFPVTDHGGPWGCEMLRLPHFRLTDGSKAVSQLPFTIRKIPGTHLEHELTPGP